MKCASGSRPRVPNTRSPQQETHALLFLSDDEQDLPYMANENPAVTSDFGSYENWLGKLRALAESHTDNYWSIGDVLAEGEKAFSGLFDFTGDGYLLLEKNASGEGFHGAKVPVFWKDVERETGMARSQLSDIVRCAKAYAPAQRFKRLSFTHHLCVANCDQRLEYLAACLVEGEERPRPISWLEQYVRQHEAGKAEKEIEVLTHSLRVYTPDETWCKLRQVARYRGAQMHTLVADACLAAIKNYLAEQERDISLDELGVHEEGRWPFKMPKDFRFKSGQQTISLINEVEVEPKAKRPYSRRAVVRRNVDMTPRQRKQLTKAIKKTAPSQQPGYRANKRAERIERQTGRVVITKYSSGNVVR